MAAIRRNEADEVGNNFKIVVMNSWMKTRMWREIYKLGELGINEVE